MFTGLIREMGKVESFKNNTLRIKAKHKAKLGDSIAINGTCLSATKVFDGGFEVELSPETLKHIVKENLSGDVHIEPAMMMGDRFEGHIVQGHIDTIGVISDIKNNGNSTDFFIKVPKKDFAYIVPKGSITIDGISLTVNDVNEDNFRLTIIPITMKETLFGKYKKGDRVNIETDMFARYIDHIISHKQAKSKNLSWDDVEHISSLY